MRFTFWRSQLQVPIATGKQNIWTLIVSRRFIRFQFKFGFEVGSRIHAPALMLHYERRIVTSVFSLEFGYRVLKWQNSVKFFLNGAELSLNSVSSRNLISHWSMNWAQFKDPVSDICLAGAVVVSWSQTQEVAGLSSFIVMTYILCHWIQRFQRNILEKLQWTPDTCQLQEKRGQFSIVS